jgi:hypothetical protein
MGFIGYAVKLIHIPINNILVLNPICGGPWLMIRLLEIDVFGGGWEVELTECWAPYHILWI